MIDNGTKCPLGDSTTAEKPAKHIAGTKGEGQGIAKAAVTHAGRGEAGLSVLFAPGSRPSAADVAGLASATAPAGLAGFAISHRPDEPAPWLELLASGLAFDLSGLAPGEPAAPAPRVASIGMDQADASLPLEAIELIPGPHLAGGEAIVPIVRVHVGLGARLTELPGVAAVAWRPAGTWIEPAYFVRTVTAWLEGGAFPALGLTALVRSGSGELTTKGLAFFAGRELRLEPGLADNAAETAKLAVRLIHHIVEAGRDGALGPQVTTDGLKIEVGESGDGRFLEVRRSTR